MSRIKHALFSNHQLKLLANHTYLYFLHLLHVLLDLLPFFIRGWILRALLKKFGKGTYCDVHVYFKFPWLVEIGSGTSINRGVEFYPDYFGNHHIVIGDNCRIAPNVRFHAGGHDTDGTDYKHTGGDISIGSDTWIGASAIILPGVRIGSGCIIGAGSVVTRDIEDWTIVAGVPAKLVRKRQPADD
ncbi:MAG: acyltransferase [Rhodothermales bacterium]